MSVSILWVSPKYLDFLFTAFFYSAWIFDVAGIILGIKGWKMADAKYAKIGIFFSVLGLLEYVLFYYVLALMFGMAG